jgi:hypothetical protein
MMLQYWTTQPWKSFDPKYGFCLACEEFFTWQAMCPNKYHNIACTRKLRPCWECLQNRVRIKQLTRKCIMCSHRFECFTNAE